MAKQKSIEKMTFEEAYKELEELVQMLEEGEQSLEDSIKLFERGGALSEYCNKLLEEAELRLTQLTPDMKGSETELDDAG